MNTEDLIKYWQQLGSAKIHPQDVTTAGIDKFANDLMPVPWVGPIISAKVYFLYLNPGLDERDHEFEMNDSEFLQALKSNLLGSEPYLYLQKRFRDHPGNVWARRIFGHDTTESLLHHFCALELVPYHSKHGNAARQISQKLPSSLLMQRYVREVIFPRAERNEVGLVVARSEKLWRLPQESGTASTVVYRGGECRGAYQTLNTRGGQLLRKLLSTESRLSD